MLRQVGRLRTFFTLLRQLIELLLPLLHIFGAAGLTGLLDLLLQILLGLLAGFGLLFERLTHLIDLPGQLLFVLFAQFVVGELLLQPFNFLDGVLEVTVLERLSHFVGRALLQILELLELLFQLFVVGQLVAATFPFPSPDR